MPVKLNSSGGGSVTLTTPSTASDFTVTVPAVTGSALVSTSGSSTSSTGIDFPSANTVSIKTNGTTAVTVDSSQNVGIGTGAPGFRLHVASSNSSTDVVLGYFQSDAAVSGTSISWLRVDKGSTYGGGIGGYLAQGVGGGLILGTLNGQTTPVEKARIDHNGNLLVGKTVTTFSTAGTVVSASGYLDITTNGDRSINCNRLTNDGNLVNFYQDGTLEGNIAVSGTTVSYNGGHLSRWSQLLTGERDASILKGTVMSNLDEMCVWEKDGVPEANEQLNRMKVSDVEGDINVAGVFVNWDNDDNNNPYDMNIAMTGDMIIRIADDVVVQKGDLLMSAGDGTAKPQGDDIVRSKTIAKVTSNHVTCTYDDGSYCVPCVLMAC